MNLSFNLLNEGQNKGFWSIVSAMSGCLQATRGHVIEQEEM